MTKDLALTCQYIILHNFNLCRFIMYGMSQHCDIPPSPQRQATIKNVNSLPMQTVYHTMRNPASSSLSQKLALCISLQQSTNPNPSAAKKELGSPALMSTGCDTNTIDLSRKLAWMAGSGIYCRGLPPGPGNTLCISGFWRQTMAGKGRWQTPC